MGLLARRWNDAVPDRIRFLNGTAEEVVARRSHEGSRRWKQALSAVTGPPKFPKVSCTSCVRCTMTALKLRIRLRCVLCALLCRYHKLFRNRFSVPHDSRNLQQVPRYVRRFQRCGNSGHRSRKRVETFREEIMNLVLIAFIWFQATAQISGTVKDPERRRVAWR